MMELKDLTGKNMSDETTARRAVCAVSLTPDVYDGITRAAARDGLTRSAWVNRVLKRALDEHDGALSNRGN